MSLEKRVLESSSVRHNLDRRASPAVLWMRRVRNRKATEHPELAHSVQQQPWGGRFGQMIGFVEAGTAPRGGLLMVIQPSSQQRGFCSERTAREPDSPEGHEQPKFATSRGRLVEEPTAHSDEPSRGEGFRTKNGGVALRVLTGRHRLLMGTLCLDRLAWGGRALFSIRVMSPVRVRMYCSWVHWRL